MNSANYFKVKCVVNSKVPSYEIFLRFIFYSFYFKSFTGAGLGGWRCYLALWLLETEIIEWDYAGFKCFQDNSFELYNPDGETCDWWRVNLTIDESPSQELSFYPNPANDEIIINNQNGVDYGLYALDGTLIEKGLIEHSHISISHLTNGNYVLGINGKKTKLVVLH